MAELEEVQVEMSDGEVLNLRRDNTLLRTFGNAALNHIEHYTQNEDGTPRVIGIKAVQAFFDRLFEEEWSYRFDKYPDKATMKWFLSTEMSHFDDDLAELLAEGDDE